ncbi:hypothetical protein FHR34_007242 [Kitasatospora kifunensis]|uniref:Uncharacterized protein n=1 Tax=Kitasatospora kifunensis TaxID=58351 RepID=A0A7W7R9Y1_KITKI|nr:hypothetical protein [Kitasatospora kifunensis]
MVFIILFTRFCEKLFGLFRPCETMAHGKPSNGEASRRSDRVPRQHSPHCCPGLHGPELSDKSLIAAIDQLEALANDPNPPLGGR